jgi:primosomal protein N''
VEMMLLMRYKVDAWSMESKMTMLDFQSCVKSLTYKVEQEMKQQQQSQTGNRLMKSLVAIRDILNYMTFNDTPR